MHGMPRAPTNAPAPAARPTAAQVKVGACDESEEEIIEALSAAGDCVLVHKIGEPSRQQAAL